MESLAQVIEKAVEKQQAALLNKLQAVRQRILKLEIEAGDLYAKLTDLVEPSNSNGKPTPPAKKPRAAISVSRDDLELVLSDMRAAKEPLSLADVTAPSLSSRRIGAALRQLAAESKVQQVKGGKWQVIVAEKVEGQEDGIR